MLGIPASLKAGLPVEISGFSHFFGFEGPDLPPAGPGKSPNT